MVLRRRRGEVDRAINPNRGGYPLIELDQVLMFSAAAWWTDQIARGIDPIEARARMDSLSDDEVIRIADQIDQLPAGRGAIEVLLVIILAGFIVLVITDLTGVTDVFPFIKSQR